MRLLVAGFITIDTIELPVRKITSIGGPPSYAGLVCSRFGLDVFGLTKVGYDFPDERMVWLARNGLQIREIDKSKSKKTTKFRIAETDGKRELFLVERCEDLSQDQLPSGRFDASLISPIAQEVPLGIFDSLREMSDFCFLDPQGFIRAFDQDGRVSYRPWNDDRVMGRIDAIKMDREEAQAVTGKEDAIGALSKLSRRGIRKALVTQGGETCHLLDGVRIFKLRVPEVKVVDSTGAGDILSGALITSYLRSRDFLWSACFGVAASSLSMDSIALTKVDLPRSVDDQARRLYASASPIATA